MDAAVSAPPLRRSAVAGMPQLGHGGLSEHWLLKECGDAHWQALAQAAGLAQPDFRDAAGARAYAAFTMLRIVGAELQRVGEHARLEIATHCSQAGRAQQYGLHELRSNGVRRARVEMLSAFVRRERAGSNRSIVRALLPPLPAEPALQDRAQALAERARALRAAQWEPRHGLSPARRRPLRSWRCRPCPELDFNGANLLYFASFQALVERAEWDWFGRTPPLADREMAFYGNLDVGESVEVLLCDLRCGTGRLAHWCELRCADDGRRLADVLTHRAVEPAR